MQHLEEISFILETIIQKICEIRHTENNIGSSSTTEKCFDLDCKEKNSTNLNETNRVLEIDDCDIVLNEGKSSSTSPKNNIFVINDSENIEKPFSLSERVEITETSSGFEDLSTTKYDENKSSSQGTERKLNETSDSKFTITVVNDVKSSEDFVIDKDEKDEEKPRILTSTPKHRENENSFHFNSLNNLNDNSNDSSSTDFNEERENGEYLNVTIDEAIEKYEKADVEAKTEFKEVSVQTIIDQLLAVQCRCGLLNSKTEDEKMCVFSSECPPSKKSKMEENLLKESESSKVTEHRQEDLKPQQNMFSSHPELDSSSTKDSTATVIINNEEGSVCFKKIFPRIRIGLSKRAKPPPLHNKLIY